MFLQLAHPSQPHMVAWHWQRLKDGPRNDFFQFSQMDCLAIGGGGAFAVWLDGDLLRGHSGLCQTFGSPCLAAHPEFNISRLELYMLH